MNTHRHTRADRVALLVLALSAAFVGGWALLAPASFYADFPGGGRHWVAADGPFNEHLVRDVGALYCALVVLTVAALVRPERTITRIAGLTWLAFAVPHLAYHVDHLGIYGPSDQVLNVVGLGAIVLLAGVLVLPWRKAVEPSTAPGVPMETSAGERR